MNLEHVKRSSGAVIGWIAVAVIFAVLSVWLKLSLSAPAIDAGRSAERVKALQEVRAAEEAGLNSAAWIDRKAGLVRLPVETTIRIAAAKAGNYAQFRAELISRADAAAPKAPAPAPKPADFE